MTSRPVKTSKAIRVSFLLSFFFIDKFSDRFQRVDDPRAGPGNDVGVNDQDLTLFNRR
jgi:hypothetical protein